MNFEKEYRILSLKNPDLSKIAICRLLDDSKPDSYWRGKLKSLTQNPQDIVLVIGDLHEPFSIKGYLQFCWDVCQQVQPTRVVQIGDILTNHRSSYHESEVDAWSAEEELLRAKEKLQDWKLTFQKYRVDVVYGNHDKNIARKFKTSQIAPQWQKSFNDVLNLNWYFQDELVIDNVLYRHNIGASLNAAVLNACRSGSNLVGGHIHTQQGVIRHGEYWACLTGVGVDRSAYDQRYAQHPLPYTLGCAVVIEGHLPVVYSMDV